MNHLAQLLHDLGSAGVEIAPDAGDPAGVRHHPTNLPDDLAAGLREHGLGVRALLASGLVADDDAGYVFAERMGVAVLLGLPAHSGSPAWSIAVGEALGAATRARPTAVPTSADPKNPTPTELAAVLSAAFGVRLWPRVIPRGQRFPGEPDWNAPYLKKTKPTTGGAP